MFRLRLKPCISKGAALSRRQLWRSSIYRQQTVPREKLTELTEQSEVEGFKVNRIATVQDFNCQLIRLEHLRTGAEYIHIHRNDSNNVFAIAFRTTPFDSTGMPHILEHLTLMGSEKYPCRDPFFKMLNRSLATYLNACTYPDFTVYPLATQNYVDYFNLMSVYLDAVFRPKLEENNFKMESWRLEHETVDDPMSPIVFKGVVFNEMKGAYSENQNIFMEKLLNYTLPSHTYGVDSGGDPLDIPQLTYEKLVQFRENHYHPSNSRIYSYGDFDLISRLKFLNDNYLKDYDRRDEYARKTAVPREPRWTEPRRQHIYGKNDPLAVDKQKQSLLTVSYLCEDVRNVQQIFELKVLAELLVDGPNSPFYKNLVEANIGSGYAPSTGYDTVIRDTIFNVGLQSLHADDFERVEHIIYKTFDECIETGFETANIENVLHSIELGLKHQGADFGLNLMFSLAPLWNHDGDVEEAMRVSEHVTQFRKNLQDKFYLQKLVEKYFKSNSHRLVLTMSPKDDYEEELQKRESELLQRKLSECSENELKNVYETGLELRRMQDAKEDSSCLPTLKVTDISRTCDFPHVRSLNLEVPTQLCTVPTNGIVYFRGLLDVSTLSEEDKILLPLFVQVVSQMGTKRYDYRVFGQMVQNKTSGLNFAVHVKDDTKHYNLFEEGLSLGSMCLERNTEAMFDLWSVLLNEVTLNDVDRFSTLVRNAAGDLVNGVADSGHLYAIMNAASRVNPAAHRREQFGGLTYIQKMKEIAATEDLTPILDNIRSIGERILQKSRMRCALNVSPEHDSSAVDIAGKFISQIPGVCSGDLPMPKNSAKLDTKRYHYVLPFAVNYCAKAVQCVPFANKNHAPLKVLSKLLSTKYLLPLVRERYGAYGAGVKLSFGGTLQFYSYRDPNTVGTIDIFDDAAKWIDKNQFTDQDIDEAKLSVFREVDAPLTPNDQGMRLFTHGISDELFSQHRLQILDVDRNTLLKVGAKYLNLLGSKVIIGPENKETKDWLNIHSD